MVGEGIESIIRSFAQALESRNLDKALAFFAPDATCIAPSGQFTGTGEIRRYLRWMFETNSELAVRECGIGILTSGSKAAFEHIVRGTFEGKKWELPMLCAYEFAGDKIKRLLTVYDRLSLAKQAAKGWLAQKAVNAVIKGGEKGLR